MANKDFFQVPKSYRTWSLALTGIGVVALIVGFFVYGASDDVHHRTRFWATLLHNSLYFLLITNACTFFVAATTLSHGGWQIAFRRVPEALSACVPIIGGICFIILMAIVFGGPEMAHIYHWTDKPAVNSDAVLKGKEGFLNPSFFTIWTILTIGLWSWLGYRMRKLSFKLDKQPLQTIQEGRRYMFNNTVWAAIYIVWFALTVMSITPWLWLMSLNAHWYSTMYSWFIFASTWEAGIALIIVFVVYLKNKGYLGYTNKEHLHDLGKFLFAFAIFWAYLWFAQFMLLWYANIPEETVYFKPRLDGVYSGIFWFSFLINFLAPFLLLMKTSPKRNYGSMTIIALIVLFGQWLNFHQLVFGSVLPEHVEMNFFDFGIALGFIGVIMLATGKMWSKFPLEAKNHPFMKESIIHHT